MSVLVVQRPTEASIQPPRVDADPLTWVPVSARADSTVEVLSQAIQSAAADGVLTLTGANSAPLDSIRLLIDSICVNPDMQSRVNCAYQQTGTHKCVERTACACVGVLGEEVGRRYVYKDSFAMGKGNESVDQKRVLDLAAHRIKVFLPRIRAFVDIVPMSGLCAGH